MFIIGKIAKIIEFLWEIHTLYAEIKHLNP